jgi:hypothetical protein
MIKPFISSNSPDTRVLFENFGVTFYYAQLLEDNLKLILTIGELQGILRFDREKDLRTQKSDHDLIKACMGPLKKVLKSHRAPNDSKEFYELLDNANTARQSLAHRFFIEHALDLQTETRRCAVNQQLSKYYLTIRNAHNASAALRDVMYSRSGFTPEMARKKIEELKNVIGRSDTDKT